jgi:hypothetical protein
MTVPVSQTPGADRHAGDEYAAIFPRITHIARSCRYFLARAVRFLAADAGIRQFLDIGTGLPTAGNTHEAASAWPRSQSRKLPIAAIPADG